jgi:hypothetical protein
MSRETMGEKIQEKKKQRRHADETEILSAPGLAFLISS